MNSFSFFFIVPILPKIQRQFTFSPRTAIFGGFPVPVLLDLGVGAAACPPTGAYLRWPLAAVVDLAKRRHRQRQVALEVRLEFGQSVLLALLDRQRQLSEEVRDQVVPPACLRLPSLAAQQKSSVCLCAVFCTLFFAGFFHLLFLLVFFPLDFAH